MTALSIYFVMQGLVAFAFRVLLLGAVTWLGWRYATAIVVRERVDRAAARRSPRPRVAPGPVG